MVRRRGRYSWLLLAVLLIAIAVYLTATNGWTPLLQKLGFISPAGAPASGELVVDYIDVGNADAILIRNEGQSMLIDAGETKSDGKKVLDHLAKSGVTKLDYVIATHFDSDHIGGMTEVINGIGIDTFILAFMEEKYEPTTKVYLNMLEALANKEVPVCDVTDKQSDIHVGSTFTVGSAQCHILGPIEMNKTKNEMSVVCRVDFGEKRFLFMGDAEEDAEQALIDAHADVKADVIKLGHHGSRSSSHDWFIEQVGPSYAVITCGEGNSYDHPHEETLDMLKARQLPYYRCDLNGTITAVCDGKTITFTAEKGQVQTPW